MERRRSSGIITKSMYYSQERALALLLTAAMVLTNLGTGLNVSYAGTADQITFQVKGADLVAAVEETIESSHEMTADDLGFTNGRAAEFEKVFLDMKGVVYEVCPEMERSSMEAGLRVFMRLPEGVGNMYMVTEDEEIILLYVNNGEETISCTAETTRMDDGVGKVKKTRHVTVRSYEDVFGDEGVDIISEPTQGETKASESKTSVESDADGTGESALPEESTDGSENGENSGNSGQDASENSNEDSGENQEEISQPEGRSLGSAGNTDHDSDGNADHSIANTGAMPPDDAQGTDTERDNAADTKAEVPKKNSGSGSDKKPERDIVDQDKDTRKQEDREEKSNKDEDKKEESAVPAAATSHHDAPVVSEKEEGSPADSADVKEDVPEKEEAPNEKETEPREGEEHKKVKGVEETAETGKEKKAETVKGTEKPSMEETREPAAPTAEMNMPDANEVQATKADNEGSAPEGTQAANNTAGSSEPSFDSAETSTAPFADASLPSESEQETAPKPVPEDDIKRTSTSDLAGMGHCSTVKVYTTSLNRLKALEDFDGYKVTYTSFPEASARIMGRARGVKEDESLTFDIKTQLGYIIDNVIANDEGLEANSVTGELDGSQTAWYTISEVYEEQNMQVYILETLEHPTFGKSAGVNGVTIRITTPEGVLPADTQIQTEEITEQMESALAKKVDAESDDGTTVSTIIAYDISLMYDGVKLDNSRAEDGSNLVAVFFSGERIEKASMEVGQIEALHLETPTQEIQAISAKAELEGSEEIKVVAQVPVLDDISADGIAVDSEGRQELDMNGSTSVGRIHFQTDHFLAFTTIFKASPYLVIANELREDSEGTEKVGYAYKVSITGSRKNKSKRLYLLTGDSGVKEHNTTTVTEGNTNTYTFNLKPSGKMRIRDIGPLAEYGVVQTIEGTYNEFGGAAETVRAKINWIETDIDLGMEGEGESFPYGYDSNNQYGSLMERAVVLMRAYTKCREYDETPGREDRFEQWWALLGISNNNVANDNTIAKLLEDRYGTSKWPSASEGGFDDLTGIVSERLEKDNVPNNRRPKNLYPHIYFRAVDSTENMEIIPYLTGSDALKNWNVYAAFDSQEGMWYQYLKAYPVSTTYMISSLHIGGNVDIPKTMHMLMEEDSDSWHAICPGEVPDIGGPIMQPAVDGVIPKFGTAYQIEYTFKNYYYNSTSVGDGPTGTSSADNDSSGNDSSEKPDNDSNNGDGNESGGVSGNDIAGTDTPGSSAGGTTNTSQDSEGSDSSDGGTTATSGGTDRYQGADAQSGPSAQQNAIESSQVPLASLPADASVTFSQPMAVIGDGEIPSAAIPKAGDRGSSAHKLPFILSGILMAVYLVLGKKKRES